MPEQVIVLKLPKCTWCVKDAEYDFKTEDGPWTYGCKTHWMVFRMYDSLGTGKGQRLVEAK